MAKGVVQAPLLSVWLAWIPLYPAVCSDSEEGSLCGLMRTEFIGVEVLMAEFRSESERRGDVCITADSSVVQP